MARKQTRRSVSIRRRNYETVQQAAAARGMTIAGLVEDALGTVGVAVVVHPQQSPELVGEITARREGTSRGRMLPRGLRRSVSMNRLNYEAAKREATRRGMSIAGLVEEALGAIGVPAGAPQPES